MEVNDVTGRPNAPQCEHGNWNGCVICRPGLKLPEGQNVGPVGMVKRLQNRTSFEDYLFGRFDEHYTGTKDSYENDLDRWMSELDVQEVIDYAEQWADTLAQKLTTDQYLCPSYYDKDGKLCDCRCGKCSAVSSNKQS